MWRVPLLLCQSLSLLGVSCSHGDHEVTLPRNCSLDCVLKGDPSCEFCSVDAEDIEATLGVSAARLFRTCVPLPCLTYLSSDQSPSLCEHYVQGPRNITVEFVADREPGYDTIVVSWMPSVYGIAFLRGFQVTLQALGGSHMDCQLFLFQRNLSLSAAHAHRVYRSNPFARLALGSQFAVTVVAVPVPELWTDFYRSLIFSTRTCPEKNGLEQCQRDWYPRHVEVRQEGQVVAVTFNLAPPHLSISHYFSWCYGGGMRNYTPIAANPAGNRTHITYRLLGLQLGTDYSCEVAANVVDAVRTTFSVRLSKVNQEPPPSTAETVVLALLLPVAVLLVCVVLAVTTVLIRKKTERRLRKLQEEAVKSSRSGVMHEECRLVSSGAVRPPRLLILYSSADGPAHIGVIVHLAAFLRQHLAVQVSLDMWEVLTLVEEGSMAWYCRKVQESDFVLVVCSRGLRQQLSGRSRSAVGAEPGEGEAALAAVYLVGEDLGRARAAGEDLSKFLTVTFEYSMEAQVPGLLALASHYCLMRDLPLLFSHLHRVALQSPGRRLHVELVSEETYAEVPAGAALLRAMGEAERERQRGPRPGT
ncbi:interleukin-17 receptor D isoform X2 [Scleropages formosus]|uniref:Si:ch211-207e14.4 n=1 Tax=Scleropages formosus TaxID=113540 RepID=A0A8C9TFZ6_SCLFO|nr:interleukin-17 receptor D-like isoform X2 [Scleropages formosus]